MEGKFTLTFEGRDYTVERGARPEAAAEGGGAPAGRNRWYITLGPKAITSLEAVSGETEPALHRRIRRWLAEHPEMPESEDIVLGGG
jgi:hypothetical protein